jgi:hypothetical protein
VGAGLLGCELLGLFQAAQGFSLTAWIRLQSLGRLYVIFPCDNRSVRQRREPGSLVTRFPMLLQMALWFALASSAGVAALGIVMLVHKPESLAQGLGPWYVGLVVASAGLGLVAGCWSCWRMGVRCDRSGIRYRSLFRTTFIPASEVKALIPRRGVSPRGAPYGVVVVMRQDGSEVRLEPTNSAITAPERIDAKLHALIQSMYQALGSVASAPPT